MNGWLTLRERLNHILSYNIRFLAIQQSKFQTRAIPQGRKSLNCMNFEPEMFKGWQSGIQGNVRSNAGREDTPLQVFNLVRRTGCA